MSPKALRLRILMIAISVFFYACSRSGKLPRKSGNGDAGILTASGTALPTEIKRNVVKIRKKNGVYEIPTDVNGEHMFFIFDTGVGMISMSNTEALFLYRQGTLTDDDILGNAKFTDAYGDISDGLVVNLKEVKIGNRTLENIPASVTPNLKAPLVFGQSALEKFGRVSIDYPRREIVFE